MAARVDGLVLGMQLLEPGFTPTPSPARTIGRLRTSGHPDLEAAVGDALRVAELDVIPLDWDDFDTGTNAWTTIYFAELRDADHGLVAANPDGVGDDIIAIVAMADLFRPGIDDARRQLVASRQSLLGLFERVELLALPTLPIFPPRLDRLRADTFVATAIETTKHVALSTPPAPPAPHNPSQRPARSCPPASSSSGRPTGKRCFSPPPTSWRQPRADRGSAVSTSDRVASGTEEHEVRDSQPRRQPLPAPRSTTPSRRLHADGSRERTLPAHNDDPKPRSAVPNPAIYVPIQLG